jgi:hypothetical protein
MQHVCPINFFMLVTSFLLSACTPPCLPHPLLRGLMHPLPLPLSPSRRSTSSRILVLRNLEQGGAFTHIVSKNVFQTSYLLPVLDI